MDFGAIGRELANHWLVYASMPVIAAVIGYVTKRVAIEMMFKPIDFIGVPPFLGWQGIVPKNARRMADIATGLLIGRLLDPQEVVDKLDPERLAKEMQEPLRQVVEDVATHVLARYQPNLWEMLPPMAQRLLLSNVESRAPAVTRKLLGEVMSDVESFVDIRSMAVENITRDKHLLNRLIRDISKAEFTFIARCGLVFGLILGLVQVVIWALTKEPLIMPAFGLVVGGATDWLALKMIFHPREPKKFLGVSWQGLFHRRRKEIAGDYGRLIAEEVLTVDAVVESLLTGPRSDRLFQLVQHEVQTVIDEQSSIAKPFVVLTVGSRRYQEMKASAAQLAMARMREAIMPAAGYASDVLDIGTTIAEKMQMLSPMEFEELLRPAFRQDEWKLITVGAIIGFLVGELQVLLLLG